MTYKLTFKKNFVSKNFWYDHNNTLEYDISINEHIISRMKVKSTLTAQFEYDSKTYLVKPIIKFFILKKWELVDENGQLLGEIKLGGWRQKRHRILLNKKGKDQEIWEFHKNSSSFSNRTNEIYQTDLKLGNKIISYNIKLSNYFTPYTTNQCLRELDGDALYDEPDHFVAILGIFLNEYFIFEEMDK